MLAIFDKGQWYFKVTADNWVHVGPRLRDLETVLRGLGITVGR